MLLTSTSMATWLERRVAIFLLGGKFGKNLF